MGCFPGLQIRTDRGHLVSRLPVRARQGGGITVRPRPNSWTVGTALQSTGIDAEIPQQLTEHYLGDEPTVEEVAEGLRF